ncbi:T9SS type A sorting domain-containing protein [Weeksellaceae bacterium KMM 9724]|uniref:T9SS type A sorting domain-containing protein n=1 Tax=Profundicola chukchiensis TaxID=2961959 RepID=UPI00243D2A72|nr:T9SS type A sorting domain-containing protein [Profundicola chukchiensis]MDG4950346.1 T9SS type A sorting domain-containing protein [Profundicola chukchiensis]
MKNFNQCILVFLIALLILPVVSHAQSNKKGVREAIRKLRSIENSHKAVPQNLLTPNERNLLREHYTANATTNPLATMANGDVYVMDVYNLVYGTFPLAGPYFINQTGFGADIFADDFDSSGTLYGLNAEINALVIMNPSNGSYSEVGPLTGLAEGHMPSGLAWNHLTSTMYALSTDGIYTRFYTIDLNTGELTMISDTGNPVGIWLAIDNYGVCYMADIATNSLYTLDLISGTETLIGDLGIDLAYAQDADVDTATNTLYMAGYLENGESNIYSVDVTTAEVTNLGPVINNGELGAFSIQGPPVVLENYSCDAAVPIELGVKNALGLSNTAGGASNVCNTGASNALWYKYTARNTGNLTITSDLSSNVDVDTRLSVYNNDCSELVCIASDDNSGANNTSEVTIAVESGVTYLIEWDDANSSSDFEFELSLDITCPDPLNFMASSVGFDTATFTWDSMESATNGYVLTVFERGADTSTATPIYTENIPAGTTSATATGLVGSTSYDAYLKADCAADGSSNNVRATFDTGIAPPVCGGKFYDTGGPNEGYGNGENYSLLISPSDENSLITLDFLSVEIDTGFDFLRIYDGDDATANELSDPTYGVTEPGIYTSNIPGGNLYITFTSDEVFPAQGWEADVICNTAPDCLPPYNLEVSDIGLTSASFSWEGIENATNGYILSIFNEGDDINTSTPIYTETIPAGTTSTTASGLTEGALLDAYVFADCDTEGVSTGAKITFSTILPPPACGGIFADSGGLTGGYSNDENITTTIYPDNPGEVVTVTFTSFHTEEDWDVLYVYDGPDASYPLIDSGSPATGSGFPAGGYSGTTIPGPFTSTDESGALTFVFMSDDSFNGGGWLAHVSCEQLSVQENELQKFVYYPNPTKGLLNLKAASNIEKVEIYNLLGQKLISSNINSTSTQIDISKLAVGNYIMRVSIAGETGTYKVLRN